MSAQHIAYFYMHNRLVFSPTTAINHYDSKFKNVAPLSHWNDLTKKKGINP